MPNRRRVDVCRLLQVALILWPTCSVGIGGEARGANPAELAGRIFADTKVQGGLVVHVECGDGKLTAALRPDERYVVQGIDADEANVQKARSHVDSLGLYGPVSIERFDGSHLPYADNLANLVVIEDRAGLPMSEVVRVLCPGGVAVTLNGQAAKLTPSRRAQPAGLTRHPLPLDSRLSTLDSYTKPWPEAIDEWTHWLHDATSNPVARDTVVGPPRHMQWFAGPLWSRSHEKSPSLTGMVSARGRLFYIGDEAPASLGGNLPDKWRLVARDAFNGVLLWKRVVPEWGWQAWSPKAPMNLRWGNPRFIHRRLVAAEDRVYVTLGYSAPVTALDAATGETVHTYEGTENTSEILYRQGVLVLSVATEPKAEIKTAPPLKVLAVEASGGKRLWEAGPFSSLYDLGERGKSNVLKQGRLMIAAGGDHVYCVTDKHILALGLADGKQAWSVPRPPAVLPEAEGERVRVAVARRFTNLGSVMYHDGRVYYVQPHVPTKKLVNNVPMTLVCLSAKSGEENWRKLCGDWSYTTSLNVYAARGLIWVHADRREGPYDLLGLDPETGEVRTKYDLASVLTTRHHHRCYRNKATENFLLMGKEGVEYVNLDTGAVLPHRWLRGMCLYGVMPANGLLYVPPQACSCNPMTMLQGYWALAPGAQVAGSLREPSAGSEAGNPRSSAPERLKKGPAYGTVEKPAPSAPEDWPMYRHDPLRSGATRTSVGAQLRESWTAAIGGTLTGPVVAGGRVYLGRRDSHELVALDADDGTVLWRYRTGGDIDTPPTVYSFVVPPSGGSRTGGQGNVRLLPPEGGTTNTLVLAGCADGWVYCLRASDGSLAWRFRGAPRERWVIGENRVASAWPIHGSVMIENGAAYVTAGRSSFLDGGMRLYMLDPRTGEALKEKTFFTEQTDQEAFYEGVTSDLLVSDSKSLFMRHLRIDPKTLELTRLAWWGFTGPEQNKRDRLYDERRGLPVSKTQYAYLRSGQGFLDDSLFGRAQFHLDGGEACHLLCFDEQRSYGFQMSTGTGAYVFFTPGGKGYSILCFDRDRQKKASNVWEQKLPLRVGAMVLTDTKLFVCGVPDVVDPDDPLASFEGRKGARLVAIGAATGETLTERELAAPPVFDGLIAAAGRLYLTDLAGNVRCFNGSQADDD